MNTSLLSFSGADLQRLRDLVTTVGTDITHAQDPVLPPENQRSWAALAVSWSALVNLLDLGKKPEMRACPVCERLGMFEATRCGYCWSALPAMPKKSATLGQ
jgi:hypothetical protein